MPQASHELPRGRAVTSCHRGAEAPQVMEGDLPWDARPDPGRAPDRPTEVGVSQRAALRADEHQAVRSGLGVAVQVVPYGVDDVRWDGDAAPTSLRLGRPYVPHALRHVGRGF